jgi:glycosyltransferase involved in cell wall biosynthesis
MNIPLVSIIIPTRNSAQFITACLESIRKQTYKNIEVIIVDQESEDGTAVIAHDFRVEVITLPKPEFYSPPTKSRNTGARHSKGAILYHLDSDMQLELELIQECVDIFDKDPSVGALIVHEKDLTHGYWSKAKALERKCYWGNDEIESARVVRRGVFEKVGGYDESINSGEDFDIHRRYKQISKISWCNHTVYHNLGYLNLAKLLNKKFQYGKTARSYFKKHSVSGFAILSSQLKSFAKNYRLFLIHPLVGTGAIALKVAEFGSGALGRLAQKS